MFSTTVRTHLGVALGLLAATVSLSAQMQPTPNRRTGEGEGPVRPPGHPRRHRDRRHRRAAARPDGHRGQSRTASREVSSVGFPEGADQRARRPAKGTKEIDGTGMYLMPGFVDVHVHCGGGQASDPEYVYKLWLAHGVTTVRGVPCGIDGLGPGAARAVGEEPDRRAAHLRLSPPVHAARAGIARRPQTPETAREWVRFAAKKGVDGLKLGAHDPEIMAALLDEAKKLNLGSTAHLDQMGVVAHDRAAMPRGSASAR